VAVLPFTDLGAGGENAFLGEGIAEEIITALAKLGGVRVAPRSASFSARARRSDVAHAGRELRVRTVLDGSVRRVGSRLRVTVQLVDTADGALRWSERYDRELTDAFALQDEIARQVAGAFAVVVAGRGEAPPPKNVVAVEFYMRGRQFFREFRRRPMEHARQMFLRAIDADPGYARAYAGLADADCFLHMYFIPTVELLAEAEEASRRALELAPEAAESRASRGLACALRKDFESADREFGEAVRLDPRLFEAHYFWGRADFQRGHLDDALRHFQDACTLREDYQAYLLLAQAIEAAGRRDEAREAYARALRVTEHHIALNPDDGRALTMGSVARARLGQRDGALRWAEQAVASEPEDPVILYAASGTYAVLGMVEESLALFSRAIRLGFANRQWIEEDPDFDAVRDDPRFRAVIDDLRMRSGARAAVRRPPVS
jgi:TolB-like protein/tetratricopeptide (TPR) repeat protein